MSQISAPTLKAFMGKLQEDLSLQHSWYVNGRHYSLTLEAWLRRMDSHRREIMPIMQVGLLPATCLVLIQSLSCLPHDMSQLAMTHLRSLPLQGSTVLLCNVVNDSLFHFCLMYKVLSMWQETYGMDSALKWWVYWRLFYLACSELFNYAHGNEWGVGHYLFAKRA